ncbi:hypothetical protein PMG11_06107 [Penicillium brasilianum]|uniref:Mitochondrial inner membrane protease subunit n=1 Tax=Penicillium brasilianum TaxID=104259 RepID=A0A0F7TKW0_PENBI|nr:hypothetical protein PMG11_06107 [Penicillium brasilianum]
MPPPDRKPQSSTMRALNPKDAKVLAQTGRLPPKTASAPTSLPQPEPSPIPEPGRPSLTRKRPLHTFFSNLRQRYTQRCAALPRPIRLMGRGARFLVPVIPICLFFSEHVAQIMWVKGPSMTPYLNEDYDQMQTKSDMVLVNMWSLHRILPWKNDKRLERGMIVTFRSPANSSHIAIKRVVGLPGDRITTREPCLKATQIIPWNHVWLEGDADAGRTLDSNTYGPVSISLITGRVIGVLSPRMRWLDWTQWESGHSNEAGSDSPLGPNYRQDVRDRVVKEAVKLERPPDY